MWDSSHAHTHYTINQIVANPWNPISPREAHWDVLIRSDLPLMCRGLFPYYCVFWGRTKPWGAWAPKWTIFTQLGRGRYRWYQSHALARSVGPTREDVCACKGGGLWWSKRGSCNPWNPTSSKEANGDVLIRSDLSLMCRGFFPYCCVLWERTKPWRAWAPKRTISI